MSRKRSKNDRRFKRSDEMAAEWDGCVTAFKWIHRALKPLNTTADYNYSGPLQGLMKALQKLDTEGMYSQRSVRLSRHPHLLEGFSLSRQTPLDTLLRTPLVCSVQKETLSARVIIPEIITGLNFIPRTSHPYFRVVASLGVVPDVQYTSYGYAPDLPAGNHLPHVVSTEWTGVKKGSAETVLELQIPYPAEYPSFALVLAVGFSFGTPDVLGNIQPVKYSGSGRITRIV
ncbi:MAG TPA: hypothetical protein VNU93_00655 [Verrucomicrobiae bacterium]|nr:hypothetical protein [Verrucomicrobiae bacterium]